MVREGLDRAAALTPGTGFLEGTLGLRVAPGVPALGFARVEAGYRPWRPLALFGFVEATAGAGANVGATAGAGARLSW